MAAMTMRRIIAQNVKAAAAAAKMAAAIINIAWQPA